MAAWTVVLHEYLTQSEVSYAKLARPPDHEICAKSLEELEKVSLNIDSNWTVQELRDKCGGTASQRPNNGSVLDHGSVLPAILFLDVSSSMKQCSYCLEDILRNHMHRLSLILVVNESKQKITVNVYSTEDKTNDLGLPALLDSTCKVVKDVIQNPAKRISDIEVISSYDLNRLEKWTVPCTPTLHTTIHGLIGRHYHERPSDVAISSTKGDVTYAELGKQSATIAQRLRDQGIRPGCLVGISLSKSVQSMVIIIGIFRAGAGYVPIPNPCPEKRFAYILQRTGVHVLIADSDVSSTLESYHIDDVKSIRPSSLSGGATPASWAQEAFTDPSQVAYVLFTSGSTGSPKGVVQEQGAVSGGLVALVEALELDSSTRFLQFASYSFDASICEFFAPLVCGGRVCVPSEEERLEDLEGAMRTLKVTDASLTPVIVSQLSSSQLPALNHLYIGGDSPTESILNDWADKVRLGNIYGLTETGVWDTVEHELGAHDNPKTIGRGIGINCWIVDPDNIDRLRPIGVEGELLIQSPYLARGYLNDTEKDRGSFLSLPYAIMDITGPAMSRCYRTGDLARCQEDGRLVFSGRRSGFVKVRGMRVELGEIEITISKCLDNGKSAVILAQSNNDQTSELVAFVEASKHRKESLADTLPTYLTKSLPLYMIPSVFVPIQSMPLTDSKKIDRQRLRSDFGRLTPQDKIVMRPGGTAAKNWSKIDSRQWLAIELSNIIADLVDRDTLRETEHLRGYDFPLPAVGLDSVRMAYLLGTIRRRWGANIGLETLQQPGITIRQLEDRLRATSSDGLDEKRPEGNKRDLLNELAAVDIPLPAGRSTKKTVFLTSITGFLGSQILRVLLEHPSVERIVGLVRAENEDEARAKIQSHAIIGQWWQDIFHSQIEVWLGDLSQPRLGLSKDHWSCLTGNLRIDGVIHDGASVNWLDDFASLKNTNIDSTREVLSALSAMPTPCPFTYVGGGYLPEPGETREQSVEKLAPASGYDQTKFVSRMMVQDYNRNLDQADHSGPRAMVIQPGFLVGTRWEGIAHPDDFLWRLAYSIVSLGAISEDMKTAHFPVTGVDQMAAMIAQSVLSEHDALTIDCHEGVSLEQICAILSAHTGLPIDTMDHQDWMAALKADVEHQGLDHPFLPVMEWFEANIWQFSGTQSQPSPKPPIETKDTIAALERSTRYMIDIGYLPSGGGMRGSESSARFQRCK